MADDRSSTLTGSISFRNGIDYTPNHVRYPGQNFSTASAAGQIEPLGRVTRLTACFDWGALRHGANCSGRMLRFRQLNRGNPRSQTQAHQAAVSVLRLFS
jgi:hypothetical protein